LIIYFSSLLGGGLLVLFIHKNHGDYNAVGASGAVCGLIFASIALFPGLGMGLFFIPINIPSWLFGILFVAYSIYGIKSGKGNISHEAHLGGALVGMIVAIIIKPSSLIENYLPISLVLVPTCIFLYIITTKPYLLLINKPFFSQKSSILTPDMRWNKEQKEKQIKIDQILDKINKKGLNSLSKKEKQQLEDYSQKK
jgi:hypothetical protein